MALTLNCIKEKAYPIEHVLTSEDKINLIKENEGKEFSYVCLMKEMLTYEGVTVESIIHGWSGVRLFYI